MCMLNSITISIHWPGWLTDWLTDWLNTWLFDWLLVSLINRSPDWLITVLFDCLLDWSIIWLIDEMIDELIDWWIDWLIPWLIDWLIHQHIFIMIIFNLAFLTWTRPSIFFISSSFYFTTKFQTILVPKTFFVMDGVLIYSATKNKRHFQFNFILDKTLPSLKTFLV